MTKINNIEDSVYGASQHSVIMHTMHVKWCHASVTKQYIFVLAKGCWCSV